MISLEIPHYEISGKCRHPLCSTGVFKHRGIRWIAFSSIEELMEFSDRDLRQWNRKCPECHRVIGLKSFHSWKVITDGNGNELRREMMREV